MASARITEKFTGGSKCSIWRQITILQIQLTAIYLPYIYVCERINCTVYSNKVGQH